jgi:hypothetical protein
MDKNCIDCSFILKSLKKSGLNSLTRSQVTALLSFTKFHVVLWKFVTSYIMVDVCKKWYHEFQNFYCYNFPL